MVILDQVVRLNMNKEIFLKPHEINDPNADNYILPILVYTGITTLITIVLGVVGTLLWWMIAIICS